MDEQHECSSCAKVRSAHEGEVVWRVLGAFLDMGQLKQLELACEEEFADAAPRDLCPACLVDLMAKAV